MDVLEKIKLYAFSIIFCSCIIGCGAKKKMSNEVSVNQKIVNKAKSYLGTPYQYGGVSRSGLDCSGLIQISYAEYGFRLPRTTKYLAKNGNKTKEKRAEIGDLIFFRTSKGSRKKSHVGIITKVENNTIEFIHSSSSNGVIISSLENPYWRKSFAEIRRYIN